MFRAAFVDAGDPALKSEFAQTNAAVISALNDYLAWLKTDLLPRSNGDFRIGADTFSKKLLYDEMVDLPLPRLLEIGYADMRQNQQHFAEVAKELEPNKDSPRGSRRTRQPAPRAQSANSRLHRHLYQPSRLHPHPPHRHDPLRRAPDCRRDAALHARYHPGQHGLRPAPLKPMRPTSFFNVTLPDPSMTPAQVEGYMHSFNIGTVISTSVHEAYPGHYVQYLYSLKAPSRVRKILSATTNVEGWAHYTEQMMLDDGYGQPGTGAKDQREAKFLRLGQLQDALLRNARFIVGIQMHTGNMTYEQAVEFFQKEGYQPKETAEVETKRGAGDPTYLYYTLGKLEIMKLRSDLMKKQGAAFSLEKFHDEFLSQGFPPIKIVREALLGDDSPAL